MSIGRILRVFGFLVLFLVALAAGAVAILTLTGKGRENLAGLISTMASSPERGVQILGISGIWSGQLRIDSVVISDEEGAWLAARGIAVDWSPRALFSKIFKADLVHAGRIEFARLPVSEQTGAAGTGGGSASGGLPVELDIARLDLPQIVLGPSLAGEIAEVSAEGSLRAGAQPLIMHTDLNVARRDGREGTLDARIDFAPAENKLALDVHGAEPAGGIIANFLRLPGTPPVEIAISGTGPAANWDLTGALSVDGQVVTKVTGKRQLTDKGNRIEAKGEGNFARFVPETFRPLIGEQTNFDFAGTVGAEGAVDIERASLDSAVLSAKAHGVIDQAAASDFALEVAARSSPASLTFGEGKGAVTITVKQASLHAFGPGGTPAIDLSASIDRVVSAEAELSGVEARLHSDGFDIARRAGPLRLSATAASGGSINETVAGLLAGALKADAATTLTENAVHIANGAIATDTVNATLSGDVSLADGSVKLDVAGQVLSAILPAAARAQLADKVNVTATLNRDAAGMIRLDPLTAKSGNIDAGGSIAYAVDRIDADLKGSLADVSKLSPQVSGSAEFTLRATGAPAAPDFAATVTSGKIAALGRELTDVSLTASGKVQPDNPTANVGLKATLAGQALAAEGVVKTGGGQHHIQGLLLTLGQNRISGDLVLDEAFLPQGSLSLALSDLGPLASLASEQVAGQVDGTLRFFKADGLPQLAINAKAASITRGDISVKDAELTGLVANYIAAPSVSGKIRAVSVSSGATAVRNVDLSLARADSWTSFSGGAIVNNIEAQASGRLAVSDGTATVELASASANGSGLNGTLPNTTVTVRNAAAGSAGGPELAMDMAGETPALLTFGEGPGQVKIIVKKVTLRASGPANAQIVDGSASFEKVITSQAELSGVEAKLHSDRFDLANRSGPVTVSATAESGGSANETIAGLLAGMLKLDAAAMLSKDSIHIEQGTFASGSVNTAVSGDASLADGSLRLDVKGDLLSALLPAAARPALDRQVSVTATVSRDAAGLLRVDPVNVASGAFNTAGSVSYAPNALDVKLRGGFADVSKLSPNAAGSIGFEVSATGAPAAPDISATISSDKFTAAGRDITGLVFSASGKADLANPAANVTIKGNVAGQALAGAAALKTANGERRIDGLSLTLGSNKISGDLALDEAFVPEGALAFTLPDIGPLAALAFEQASGAINGTVRFTKADRIPQVAVDAKAASIRRGDLSVSNAEVTALVANYLVAPAVSGKVRAASVISGGTSVRNVDLSLTRDGSWTGFDGGAIVNDVQAKATGRVAIAAGTTTVELASGSANTRGITATLARPTTVTVKGGGATLDHATLGVGGGTVDVTGTAGQSLNLDVRINAVPANIVNAFAPGVSAAGSISGTARISGAAANPNIDYQLEWKGAQTTQTRDAGFGAMNVASSGNFSAGVVRFTADLGDAAGLRLRGSGTVETGGGRALSLDASGQVPFGFLTKRLAAQGLALSGTSNVSLNIRGSTSAPVIGGTITTSGSRLVDARSGLAINNINADIALANSVATIRRVDGKLSSGGSLSGSGTVAIDAARGFPADLSARIVDARYTDGRLVTANLGGNLILKGPLTGQPLLSGTIDLARTVITIPERLPGSAAALGVQHRNAPAAVREQSAAIQPASPSGSSASGLTLDLTINAPQEIFVRGRGLDAELGGSIKLTGPLSAPRAIGEFTLRRGRLTVLARRLTFTRGTLGFAGSLIPTLDFAAESTVSDTTVTITVTGLANDPKFNFSSSPALPQDEVLARLIFGRSMSNLSPLQIAQLADAAAQLAGGGSGSLLNTLRSKAGIDDLDITTDEQGRAAVSAGKYLNERTYVTIQKGEKPGSGKATIDLDVGRGVKLRGEAAEDGSAKGGVFYEREY